MTHSLKRFLTLFLSLITVFTMCSCSSDSNTKTSSTNTWGDTIGEDVISESVISGGELHENTIKEFITEEIYINEIVIAEDMIKENLLQDERISEVLLCNTIFIPQGNLQEFSDHSGTTALFGEGIDIGPLLAKVAIGTGIILTLTILSISGLEGPVASIVAAAAPAAAQGAAVGTLIGGLAGASTGAADEVDQTGRTSSIICFSLAIAGLVLATISAIGAIPSGGGTAAGVVFGIKLAIAGISLASAAYAGYNMVKKLTTTDAQTIDWDNIDWDKVGVSAAEQAINSAADGYLWGSVIGAVEGGANGYLEYEKVRAPYSTYEQRIKRTPVNGDKGHWTGERGESTFVLNEPITLDDGTVVSEITYTNGIPDFSDYALGEVDISNMTGDRYGTNGNFEQANQKLAEQWTKIKYQGKTWTADDIEAIRYNSNGDCIYSWHELNNMHTMQLVPTIVNGTWSHLGGVSEYNIMISLSGNYYD